MIQSDPPYPEPPTTSDQLKSAGRPSDAEVSADEVNKVSDIRTVEALIVYAYQQEGKRFTVPGQVFETIARQPRVNDNDERKPEIDDDSEGDLREDPALELVLDLAKRDPLLAVPPRLLVEIEDGNIDAAARKRLLLLVAAVLKCHAAFRSEALQASLLTAPTDRKALFDSLRTAAIRTRTEDLTMPGTPLKELKAKEREKLASNALTSLALLLSMRDRWTTEEFAECLHTHLWHTSSRGSRRPKALLADSRTPDALDVVADMYAAQTRRAELLALDQERHAEQAIKRAFEAQALLEQREAVLEAQAEQIAALRQRIAGLEGEVEHERKVRIVDRSHHVDDYESMRTRVIRMLDKQTQLLSDGLHALQNGSPGVTEEYLDRTLVAFSRELQQLKMEEGGS